MKDRAQFPVAASRRTEDKPQPRRKLIGELLVLDGLITERQLLEALELQRGQGGRIVEKLILLGYISAHAFLTFLARQPGVSSIVLANCRVRKELLSLVPQDFAASHQVFPIDRLGKLLTVGMACPLDRGTVDELQNLTGLRVKPMLCSPECIKAAIARHYGWDDEFAIPIPGRKELYRLQWAR